MLFGSVVFVKSSGLDSGFICSLMNHIIFFLLPGNDRSPAGRLRK